MAGRTAMARRTARPEPWPEEPEPGDGDPSRRGRHAAPDPLPPIEGPMPGGGPSPAETTLPLALKWPAPPTRPHRSPPPAPPGSPGAPPGWRRVPRTTGYPPAGPAQPPARSPPSRRRRTGRRERPGPRDHPCRPEAPAAAPGPQGPAERRPPRGGPAACTGPALQPGPVRRRHGGRHPGLPGHRLPAHPRAGVRGGHPRARQRVQQLQHAAEHRLLPDARRHLHQRGGAAAGPGGPARPGPRRGLRAAGVQPRRAGPARGHRAGDAAGRPAGRPVRAHHPRLRAQPDGGVGLLLHPADLLLRHERPDRGDPEHPRPVRRADVDPGHQ